MFEDNNLKVYPTHIHYFVKGAFGVNEDISIPINQVSSIKIGFVNVTVETNGGKKYKFISGKQNEFRDVVFKAQQMIFQPQNADFQASDLNELKPGSVNADLKNDNNVVTAKTEVSDNLKFKHVSWKEQLKRFFIGFVVIVGGTLALVFLVTFFGNKGSGAPAQNDLKETETVKAGDTVILNINGKNGDCSGIIWLGKTKQAEDEITKASIAQDSYGIYEIFARGEAMQVKNCVKAKAIDLEFSISQVRILEGDQAGNAGWLPSEWVIK